MNPTETEVCCERATGKGGERLRAKVEECLKGIKIRPKAFDRLVAQLAYSKQKRKPKNVESRWSKKQLDLDKGDIAYHIQCARDDKDLDEACWRAFLAGHFGRSSTRKQPGEKDSAGQLLCAFGAKPFWTWKKIRKDGKAFRDWLRDNKTDPGNLVFGNHRKFESNKPKNLWRVIASFIKLAAQHDNRPSKVFEVAAADASDNTPLFRSLYCRLRGVRQFGRTGCFDLLTFMADLRLIDAKPDSCYLKGSTGPKAGAKQLWGKLPVKELDELALHLANCLKVSPQVVEDALCNWHKKKK